MATLTLTKLEATVLLDAAGLASEDVGSMGWNHAKKAAFTRVMEKLDRAIHDKA